MAFEVMSSDPERRVEVAIADIKAGRMVILVDDEDRENEGDLTMAASAVTPEAINFMATWGRGLICLTLTEDRVETLQLPMMSSNNRAPFATAFTVSVEAREGVSTGISAADRAHTILVAIDEAKGGNDLVTPGHVFPLRSRNGGVLVRTGQTEGSVDLARLAGLTPAGVICEVMNDDGTMARLTDLERFGEKHQIHIVTIADLIRWRMRHEQLVTPVMDVTLPTEAYGTWNARVYRSTPGGLHMALWRGDPAGAPVLVRVQASAGPVDVFRPLSSDSADQIQAAMARIHAEGRGVVLYMHIDGSEEALLSRLREHLGAAPPEPTDALRELGVGAQILAHLGACEIRLLTNNPRKIVGLEGYGVNVVERIPLSTQPNADRVAFLAARSRSGHLFPGDPVG